MSRKQKNVLAVGAHADDVEIGCGGTIALHAKRGDNVILLIMSESSYTYYDGKVLRTKEEAELEEKNAAKILGVKKLINLGFKCKEVPYSVESIEAINRVIDKYKIDIIYTRYSPLAIGLLTFNSLAPKTIVKIPSIVEDEISYCGLTKKLTGKFIALTDKIALLKAGTVATLSKALYCELLRRRGVKETKKFIELPPGVNLDLIEKIHNLKRISKTGSESLTVGFIGTITWWQGLDILVKAINQLKEKNISIRLLIIGDGPMRSHIERMLKDFHINYKITGFVSHEKALEYLCEVDVLAVPRRHTLTTDNVIPIKVIEAWALGIPVIITKHRIFLECGIKNFEDVIYCEPNPSSVANSILMLLSDSNLKNKLKRNGFKILEAPIDLNFKRFSNRIGLRAVWNIFIDTIAIFFRLNILHYYDG